MSGIERGRIVRGDERDWVKLERKRRINRSGIQAQLDILRFHILDYVR